MRYLVVSVKFAGEGDVVQLIMEHFDGGAKLELLLLCLHRLLELDSLGLLHGLVVVRDRVLLGLLLLAIVWIPKRTLF